MSEHPHHAAGARPLSAAVQQVAAVANGAGLDVVYNAAWTIFPWEEFKSDLRQVLAALSHPPITAGASREQIAQAIRANVRPVLGHGALGLDNISVACAADAVLSLAAAPGWRPIETAPPGVDFVAINARGDIRRCWRNKPSSRTDEILTFDQRRFKAIGWLPLDALPASPDPTGAG